MTFIDVTAYSDGRELRIRSKAITSYWTVTPTPIGDAAPRPGTVVHIGSGMYSEWIAESRAELAVLIAAAEATPPRDDQGRPHDEQGAEHDV